MHETVRAEEIERSRARVRARDWKPRNCVWELTLACNLRCVHCGSRAGRARRDELSLSECRALIDELAALGCEVVTLSGGEPTMREDWDAIGAAIAERGILVNMVTNGVYRTDAAASEVARRAAAAGLCNVGVSLDGTEEIHDHLRGAGTFSKALRAVERFREAGLAVTILTTVNRLNLPLLPEVREVALEAGAQRWRLQLAKPMGSLGEHRDLVISPAQLLTLVPLLARLKKAGGLELRVGDSIGYYGPHDEVLRGKDWRGRSQCWQGCQAGMQAIGIEADGGIKGCLSLQAKWGARDPFVEANVRESSLEEIWHRPGVFAFNRDFRLDSLTGSCRGCRHASLCRGGARCVSSAFCGVLTEDPYCYYRVSSEQAVDRAAAAGRAAVAAAVLAVSSLACSAAHTPADDAGDAAAAMDAAPARDASEDQDASGGQDASGDGDAATADAGPIDCSSVCCECEYGILPPEVAAHCCAPDPCAGVCCECDYGDPPPPECCPSP